jgi:hypothetical protein
MKKSRNHPVRPRSHARAAWLAALLLAAVPAAAQKEPGGEPGPLVIRNVELYQV